MPKKKKTTTNRPLNGQNNYSKLILQIKTTLQKGQIASVKAVRRQLVLTYWGIGKHIVEYEQK